MEYSAVTGRVYSSTLDALRSIARTEGLHGLFRGLGVTIARDAPYSGLYLLMYDNLRRFLRSDLPQNTPQTTINFVAVHLSITVVDVVHPNNDHMCLAIPAGAVAGPNKASTPRPRFDILGGGAEHGVRGFFKGVTPRVAKRALQQALSWTLFEEITQRVSGRNIWGLQK
eukprot:SM000013S26362  [mRNA]  locus=s13:48522:50241:+ [translate_table: standard]